jgi:hypothetical protein
MTVAIMQPYLFPYLGYFQLMHAVDRFVIYDDVSFIKQGWINRNRILINGCASMMTVPLRNKSSFSKIQDVEIDAANRGRWQARILRGIETAYRRAPQFAATFPLVRDVVSAPVSRIAEMARASLRAVARHLGIETSVVETSTVYDNAHLAGEERVLDICAREHATCYVNAIGGRALYSEAAFRSRGIALRFLETRRLEYVQMGHPFVSDLSMIDVLMFNPRERASDLLAEYDLVA